MTDTTSTPEAAIAPDDLVVLAPDVLADSLPDYLRAWWKRIRGGESGALPIIVGLLVISIFFTVKSSAFLTSTNIVNLFVQSTFIILLGMAELYALILSEIDLSVGFVGAVGASIAMALISAPQNWVWWAGVIVGLAACALIGAFQGTLITRLRIPSFVVTLAGLLGWQGVLIFVFDSDKGAVGGVITVSNNIIDDLVSGTMTPAAGWILLFVVVALYAVVTVFRTSRRRAQGLTTPPLSITFLTLGAVAVAGAALVFICNRNRGIAAAPVSGVPWVIPFVLIVLAANSFLLARTRLGRYMYAIGASPEAARRAGIHVARIRTIAFALVQLHSRPGGGGLRIPPRFHHDRLRRRHVRALRRRRRGHRRGQPLRRLRQAHPPAARRPRDRDPEQRTRPAEHHHRRDGRRHRRRPPRRGGSRRHPAAPWAPGRGRLTPAARSRAAAVSRWTGAARLTIWAALVLIPGGGVLSLEAPATNTAAAVPSPSASTPSWTVYHGDPQGSGVAATVGAVHLSSRAWTSPALDGQLYGEPLVSGGRIFVATENDTVYALSATTGAVEWSNHVGTPVPVGSLPCGNISPSVGITGTPVIDETRSELFVVADQLANGTPAHQLLGLDTSTGRTELRQHVDPAGADPAALLQRTGLTLDAGRVVFGFGGNYGDCGTYRGWVIGVPEAGGDPATFAVDSGPGESQGAIWMGGAAPAVDAAGNVWVTAGNGSVTSSTHAYDHSDSVLELSPTLTLLQFFAPSSWAADNAGDLDLSTAPALLADGQVVVAGKSRTAYLLDGPTLGGIGGEQASVPGACGDNFEGGSAVVGDVVYLPCQSGTIAVRASASPPALRVLWRSPFGGGPPVVAAGRVWTMSGDGVLYALDPSSGAARGQVDVGSPANHFSTPSVGAGLLLAASANRVVAFTAPPAGATTSTTTAAASTTTTVVATTTTAPAGGGGSDAWVAAVALLGGLGLVSGLAWFVVRRRRQ